MNPGGTERQLIHLAAGLIGRRIDVHVVTAFAGELDGLLLSAGVPLTCLNSRRRYDPRTFRQLRSVLRKVRPDVVHTFLTQMDIVGGIAARWLGIPWVLSERSVAAAYPANVVNNVRAMIGKGAAALVANSPAGAEYWRERIRTASVHVIPNVVPRTSIDSTPTLNQQTPISSTDRVILIVGRFSPEKNLHTLTDALVDTLREPGFKAVFCGDGPLRSEIEQLTAKLGIRDRCLFLGVVSNVWSWMKRADVLVSVSAFEGNPNVVLEGAAAGVPLVLSDIAAHRAILPADAALFVDGNAVHDIGRAIGYALSDREGARIRAAKAREAVTFRSEEEIAASYEAVYRDVIASSRRKT